MNKVEKYKELIQTAAALISRRVTSTDMEVKCGSDVGKRIWNK